MHTSRTGRRTPQSRTASTRSSRRGRPNRMSSTRTTTGRCAARHPSVRRKAQEMSLPVAGRLDQPEDAGEHPGDALRMGVGGDQRANLRASLGRSVGLRDAGGGAHHLGDCPVRDPVAVVQAPAAEHRRARSRPGQELAHEAALAGASRRQHREQLRSRASHGPPSARSSASSSAVRPTSGVSNRRRCASGPTIATSRAASIPPALPFASTRRARPPPRRRGRAEVSPPSRTSPGAAACWSRAATLTVSPETRAACRRCRPRRAPRRCGRRRAARWGRCLGPPVAIQLGQRAPSSAAARTARSASSSWRVGQPKTAMTASPMNFSTVPPWRSMTPRSAAK